MREGLVPRNLVAKVMGDPPAKERLESLLEEQKKRVRATLSENLPLVSTLRDALLERDELVGDEIIRAIESPTRQDVA